MSRAMLIARRELTSMATSPYYLLVSALFFFVCGIFFSLLVFYGSSTDLRDLYLHVNLIILLLTPIISTRLITQEVSSGTFEFLFTSSASEWEILLGKYTAGSIFLSLLSILTGFYPFLLTVYAQFPLDINPVLTAHVGLILWSFAYMSVGVFTSCISRSQVLAAVSGFAMLLLFIMFDYIGDLLKVPYKWVVRYLSLWLHYEGFAKGLIDLRNLLYPISVIMVFLFLGYASLLRKRWG